MRIPMRTLETLDFDNRFAGLPEEFHSRVLPAPIGAPYLVDFNPDAAALIDLDPAEAARPEFVEYFCGRRLLPGSAPIAAVYSGHQFGVYVPRLGDGRALLLGEVRNSRGERWDVQLKGAGPTPYSRMGDGRAVLRSTIREYLCSEAMHGLGIPSTRALCIVGSDAPVYRETVETGATLTRLAPSHVRFGSFEYFAYTGQPAALARLADHVIAQHHPELLERPEAERYPAWFDAVVARSARLVARWQAVGFAHGVLNTDNMSILGLTLDYGPFGFLDAYQPRFVCNHSDSGGRYAFDRQPNIVWWNLAALAQALSGLIATEALRAALEHYAEVYAAAYVEAMAAKLGLREPGRDDGGLISDWLALLARFGLDYTNSFRALGRFVPGGDNRALRERFPDREAFDAWAQRYAARLAAEGSRDAERRTRMERANPKIVLRNYLAQAAIAQAQAGDFAEVARLRELLRDPYTERPGLDAYAAEPPDWGRHLELSCSS